MSYWQTLSRREALRRMSVLAATLTMSPNTVQAQTDPWSNTPVPSVDAPGYGTDPILNQPEISPWPRILSQPQLNQVAQLAELICPGSTTAGVPDVLNEWLSAPYPDQTQDRALILPGLAWLESTNLDRLPRLIEQIDQGKTDSPELRFLARLRILITGAYFSSPEGTKELGYVGNRPIAGDYPGPSDPAMSHLEDLLNELDLEL